MKKSVSFFLAVTMVMTACAADGWRAKVGLPENCKNPVFTMPSRMNKSNRVEGAGINMNDGEAYTLNNIKFSNEWHYAPKLNLCDEETAQMPQVMGLFMNENERNKHDFDPLKFSAKAVHGCYAVVVYRAFRNGRYFRSEHENLEQFIAVYDEKGQLTDAMMMGYYDDIRDILLIEPHKQYSVPFNMGDYYMDFDKKDPSHFTLNRYWYLKDEPKGSPGKVAMKRYYTITPAGKIKLDKVTNGSEDYTAARSNDVGAPIADVANAEAVNLLELILTPMSDAAGNWSRLDRACAKLLDNPVVGDRVMHLGMMFFNRNPKAFINYAYKNRTKTSLIKLLKKAKNYHGEGRDYEYNIDYVLDKNCATRVIRKWFAGKLK
jgi:hypothetical protein